MTLFECMTVFVSTNTGLLAKLPGGFHPGYIPENKPFPLMVMRYVSGASQPPTHDGGASPWSRVRLEFTIWGKDYKTAEQCAFMLSSMFESFNGNLGGGANGRFGVQAIQGPRDVWDETRRMPGMQIDIIGLLNGGTLS
jgi:hypothetical protein